MAHADATTISLTLHTHVYRHTRYRYHMGNTLCLSHYTHMGHSAPWHMQLLVYDSRVAIASKKIKRGALWRHSQAAKVDHGFLDLVNILHTLACGCRRDTLQHHQQCSIDRLDVDGCRAWHLDTVH